MIVSGEIWLSVCVAECEGAVSSGGTCSLVVSDDDDDDVDLGEDGGDGS